jgi:hypothetical protein
VKNSEMIRISPPADAITAPRRAGSVAGALRDVGESVN